MLRSFGSRAGYALHHDFFFSGKTAIIQEIRSKARNFGYPQRRGKTANAHEHRTSADQAIKKAASNSQYTLQTEAIHLVDSFAALEEMQRQIFLDEVEPQVPSSNPILDTGQEPSTSSANLSSVSPEEPQRNGALQGGGQASHTYRIVGMDAEWQPSHSFSPVSLLQISTRRSAFLIDMMWFCRPAPSGWSSSGLQLPELTAREAALDRFLSLLLASENIIKAGFAFHGDLRNLCRSFPHMPSLGRRFVYDVPALSSKEDDSLHLRSYVDLKRLAFRLWPDTDAVARALGLAKLTALILNLRLDKTYQISDWAVRPLTEGQKQYAGSDAHVLTALADKILSASQENAVQTFPASHTETLDIAMVAKEARLWHKVRPALSENEKVWSWEPLLEALPKERFDPSGPDSMTRHRLRQGTPRLPSKAIEHGVNFAALQEFLGFPFPKGGRSVIVQVASTSAEGDMPRAIPQYSRGGGVIAWRNSIMLFVNADTAQSKYANTFLEGGRKLVWFPSPGQTQHHPLMQRMLRATGSTPAQGTEQGAQQDKVLLFCRMGMSGRWLPYVHLGQLISPAVDWSAGSTGTFVWELKEYEHLLQKPAFLSLVKVLGSSADGAKYGA